MGLVLMNKSAVIVYDKIYVDFIHTAEGAQYLFRAGADFHQVADELLDDYVEVYVF